MPLDPRTFDSDTPETLDKRRYPEHLKAYHFLDAELLPIAAELREFILDDLAAQVSDAKIQAALPRWLASATWRGLIKRTDHGMASVRTNAITERGLALIQSA